MKAVYVLLLTCLLIGAFVVSTVEATFGCPFSDLQCLEHCKSMGYSRGYCTNFIKESCECFD